MGRRTRNAILPLLERLIMRAHGQIHLHVTQILTGHGCFGSYVYGIDKVDILICRFRGATRDTPQHTLQFCTQWNEYREKLRTFLETNDLILSVIVSRILQNQGKWRAFSDFCTAIILCKEEEERTRQAT